MSRHGTQKKKYRYRWPDEMRDEVLARLLELNRQRALEEGQVVMDGTGSVPDAKLEEGKKQETEGEENQAGFTRRSVRDGQEEA